MPVLGSTLEYLPIFTIQGGLERKETCEMTISTLQLPSIPIRKEENYDTGANGDVIPEDHAVTRCFLFRRKIPLPSTANLPPPTKHR